MSPPRFLGDPCVHALLFDPGGTPAPSHCDAPGSEGTFSVCMGTFDCWLIFIPTSLLTDLSGVGVATHIGTGGSAASRRGEESGIKQAIPLRNPAMEEPNEVDVNAYPCDQVLRGLSGADVGRLNQLIANTASQK